MDEINTFAEPVIMRCDCPSQEIDLWRKNEFR